MAIQIQLRQGTTTEHNSFTGAVGEVTVDTTNKTLRVHDGSTVGGTRLATLTGGLVPTTQLPAATTSVQGAVILNNTVTSTSATQALTAAQGKFLNDQDFGIGQSYVDVTTSRVVGTTYTNNTRKPIMVSIVTSPQSGIDNHYLYVGNVIVSGYLDQTNGDHTPFSAIVPNGSTYRLTTGSGQLIRWVELR